MFSEETRIFDPFQLSAKKALWGMRNALDCGEMPFGFSAKSCRRLSGQVFGIEHCTNCSMRYKHFPILPTKTRAAALGECSTRWST